MLTQAEIVPEQGPVQASEAGQESGPELGLAQGQIGKAGEAEGLVAGVELLLGGFEVFRIAVAFLYHILSFSSCRCSKRYLGGNCFCCI